LRERAQDLLRRSATFTEAVRHGQSNMLVENLVSQLTEICAAVAPITERSWISRLFRLNRIERILDTSNQRLNEAWQRFMVCQQYLLLISASLIMIGILKVGIVTQIRAKQKDDADRLVCPVSYDHFTDSFISTDRKL
jgi:hypothetical protein